MEEKMKQIRDYSIELYGESKLSLPADAMILRVGPSSFSKAIVSVLMDETPIAEDRIWRFFVVPTGRPFKASAVQGLKYWETIDTQDGRFCIFKSQ